MTIRRLIRPLGDARVMPVYEDFSSEAVTDALRTQALGRSLHLMERVDSTNTEAARLGAGGASHGTVVWAEDQTAGRGRQGRTWQAHPGKSLCVSVVIRPHAPQPQDRTWLQWIPLAAALGVASGIRRMTGLSPTLKWPNDLLLNERKCCGLLCENTASADRQPLLIVGFGINVTQQASDFAGILGAQAVSLTEQCGAPVGRAALLAAILNDLEPTLEAVWSGELTRIRETYRHSCGTIGRLVSVERQGQDTLRGIAQGVADSGALVIVPSATPARPSPLPVEVLAGDVVHLRSTGVM